MSGNYASAKHSCFADVGVHHKLQLDKLNPWEIMKWPWNWDWCNKSKSKHRCISWILSATALFTHTSHPAAEFFRECVESKHWNDWRITRFAFVTIIQLVEITGSLAHQQTSKLMLGISDRRATKLSLKIAFENIICSAFIFTNKWIISHDKIQCWLELKQKCIWKEQDNLAYIHTFWSFCSFIQMY